MRWYWIDRYVEFEAGVRATAVKAVTLAEEHLHDHFPGFPVMPNSLVLEGLAQTGGLLVAQQNDFMRNVVLAKVTRAKFHLPALPGDTLTYRAKIENLKVEGASVSLTSHIGERLQAEADVFFAHVDNIAEGQQLFPAEQFNTWLRMLRIFDVGRYPDGRRLEESPEFRTGSVDSRGASGSHRQNGSASVGSPVGELK